MNINKLKLESIYIDVKGNIEEEIEIAFGNGLKTQEDIDAVTNEIVNNLRSNFYMNEYGDIFINRNNSEGLIYIARCRL